MIITCLRPISGFKLEIQCPLTKKTPEKILATMTDRRRKFFVFQIVIRTQKCFERIFALSALLIVFHCII